MAGIEQTFESELRGTPGYIKYEVDAREPRASRSSSASSPCPGNDVQLTIDLKVQQYAEQILQAGIKQARTSVTADRTEAASTVVLHGPGRRRGGARTRTPARSSPWRRTPPFDNRWFVGGIRNAEVRRSSSADSPATRSSTGPSGQLPDRLDDEDDHVGRRAADSDMLTDANYTYRRQRQAT